MEKTIGKRLVELRKAKGLSVEELATKLKIKGSAVYGLQTDANKPSFDTLAAIMEAFPDVNIEWLINGKGEMLREGKSLTPVKEGFFPGSHINHMGASVGELPDIDMSDTGGTPSLKTNVGGQSDKEFRDMLIKQLGKYKDQLASKDVENSKLHRIIEQLQQTIDFLQEQLSEALTELRGKIEGNQLDAPGLYVPEVPRNTVGFALNRKPKAKLIAMYPYGVPTHEPVLMQA